jgi:hypothetical protein
MKTTDLAILFVIITLPFMQILRIKSDNLQNTAYRSVLLNSYIDAAVEDASQAMIELSGGNKITISREKAMNAFLQTLFINFNVNDRIDQLRLMAYIPAVVLIDYDGFSICSMEEYINSEGDIEQKMVWKPKKPYAYESDGFIYLFTLDSYVKVYNSDTNIYYEGSFTDLKEKLPGTLLKDVEIFEQVRKRTIVEAIESEVNNAINLHNTYAGRFGISYRFSPPSISNADWHRNIEDVGFLAFIQGIPIGLGGERFNSFALGASRIVRKKTYYIQQDSNGLFYYHRSQCPNLTEKSEAYDSREECAGKGAFPCHYCRP